MTRFPLISLALSAPWLTAVGGFGAFAATVAGHRRAHADWQN
jgi:hypothetical protein